MQIVIDRHSKIPIYRQIVDRIREQIVGGMLPEGFRLPPERRLAEALGVNRSTVLTAYRELKAEGLLHAHVGRGTSVHAPVPATRPPAGTGGVPWRQLFREGGHHVQDPVVRDLLELTERRDVVSLAIGLPAPELLPLHLLGTIFDTLVEEAGPQMLLHCPTEGHTPLRETLTRWLATRGIACSVPEVLVLSGSQQGLDLMVRALVDPGDLVVVEEPTYVGILPVLRAAQARVLAVPVDHDGMRTDVLEAILERHRPKLIYTLPTFQNPSGVEMSLTRRKELLELSARTQVPILEDDPYSELCYDGSPLPSLKALDSTGHVVYLSTLSKVLFPGMRLGFLVGPRPLIRRLALLKQGIDLHSSSVGQRLLDRFIRDGHYEPYLATLRTAYAERRDTMDQALSDGEVSGLAWTKPRGGFYFWCRLPREVERSRLLNEAADAGVAYLPGDACFAEPPADAFVRLNFSYSSPERIRDGVVRFLESVHRAARAQRTQAADRVGMKPVV
ncbi:MAG: PLP-dependent aminotransferase family protein [Acidobacteria bacterium]|nr:PLP-dependent aminotransferase family protein [Acidobacteriota bacterium]